MSTLTLLKGCRPALTDDEIRQVAHGDTRAAADLVIRKYRSPLYHHAAGILKDREEAIDVTQEVFIRAMREKRFFDADFKIKAWLYRVTTNLCFNLVRNRKRRAAILETVPQPKTTDAHQIERVYNGERKTHILRAMDQLTESHRKILMLRYYGDMSYAEVADTLDIKLGTVMSRLSRAKHRLMEVLVHAEGCEDVQEV
jgi:RNA polymerase sigma-70 factor (ECF subfamily)